MHQVESRVYQRKGLTKKLNHVEQKACQVEKNFDQVKREVVTR